MDFLPAFRDFRENLIVAAPVQLLPDQVVVRQPLLAHGQIAHPRIEHGHCRRSILDEQPQLFLAFLQGRLSFVPRDRIAERRNAVGKIIGQFAEQLHFVRRKGVRLAGINGHRPESLACVGERQDQRRGVAVPEGLLPPRAK